MIARRSFFFAFAVVSALTTLIPSPLSAQTPKYEVAPDAPPPVLAYHGLIAGKSTLAEVKQALGEPAYAGFWYNYKLYYPALGRPEGMVDAVHMHGDKPESKIGSIEAASVPEGFATEADIRAKLGAPEYEFRMHTWKLLDYSELGLRFTLDATGKTTGVAYVAAGFRRVPEGERNLVDLSGLKSALTGAPADLEGLQVGTAERVVSPTEPSWLPYPYKVITDLKVRIAVFAAADLKVALVGADLFGMNWDDIKVIRDAAAKAGVDQTVFAMAHNHAAGDTIGVYGHYPKEYIQHIQTETIAGIQEALGNLAAVKELRVAGRELPMDGTRVMGLFRNARNPGVLDPNLSIIQPVGEDGKPLATIINFACHTESLEKDGELGADFPGYMCDQVKADGGGQPVFLNGNLGGMVSGDNKARTQESSKEMGLQLAALVKELSASAQPIDTFTFEAETRTVEIPVTNPMFKAMMKQPKRPVRKGRMLTDMTYIEFGPAQIVTFPGEVLPEVSFEVLEVMQGFPRMLVGLANDEIGYIIPPYDFRDDYYEETMSVGPATAPQIRDMARGLVKAHQP